MTMLTRLKTLGGGGMLSAIMELHDQITSTAAVHLDHCLSSHVFAQLVRNQQMLHLSYHAIALSSPASLLVPCPEFSQHWLDQWSSFLSPAVYRPAQCTIRYAIDARTVAVDRRRGSVKR